MGLFSDLFSTKPAEEAAAAKRAGLQQGYDALSGQYGAGRDALTTDLGYGRDAINTGYGDASALYTPLVASTAAGSGAYGDATGANGAEGLARAKALFTATPGYQSGFDLLTDANDRRAASRGILSSGNTLADTAKLATTYSDQNYGNYVNHLAPYLGANASAVGGAAGVDVGRGTALNANFGALGSGLNASYMGQGGAANANFTGQGQATADADMAKYGASQNFWSALAGGANTLLKASGVGGFAPSGKVA